MKSSTSTEITVSIKLERGEWVMRTDTWSIASVSFTIYRLASGDWSTRINHAGFTAYERRWAFKTKAVFSSGRRFPGFYPRREDIPGNVLMALHGAYIGAGQFPAELPALEEGKWEYSS
jgi:hypothetical protein